jgi:hypothetical protein
MDAGSASQAARSDPISRQHLQSALRTGCLPLRTRVNHRQKPVQHAHSYDATQHNTVRMMFSRPHAASVGYTQPLVQHAHLRHPAAPSDVLASTTRGLHWSRTNRSQARAPTPPSSGVRCSHVPSCLRWSPHNRSSMRDAAAQQRNQMFSRPRPGAPMSVT